MILCLCGPPVRGPGNSVLYNAVEARLGRTLYAPPIAAEPPCLNKPDKVRRKLLYRRLLFGYVLAMIPGHEANRDSVGLRLIARDIGARIVDANTLMPMNI